jgi:hypothetical protein
MTQILLKRISRLSVIFFVLLLAAFQSSAYAGETQKSEKGLTSKHNVPEKEIRASAVAFSAERNASVDKVARLLDSEAARKRLAQWGINVDQAESAISRLDNAELEFLAARIDNVMGDLQGGKPHITKFIYYGLILMCVIVILAA